MTADEQFIRRAIRLAMNGRGRVEPNPMVGCVLVKDGRVIGEGYHTHFGGPHAEPTALANCAESPEGATAYVTLEPCCHTNKKTPPCAPRLIQEKMGRVVVGCLDPNPAVNGKGVRMLRDAGIQVDGPMLEAECKQLIAPFMAAMAGGFYKTLKWAESADGRVAGPGGHRLQISNQASSKVVQELRARCDAIAVGINTVLNDDPVLLPRGVPILRLAYRRMVLDTKLWLPLDSQLVRTANLSPVEVYAAAEACRDRAEHRRALLERGVLIDDRNMLDADRRVSVGDWFEALIGNVTHLLVEPGPTLASSLLYSAADRVWVIRSGRRIDSPTAPLARPLPSNYVESGQLDLDGDRLTEYLNTRSAAFFAPVPSADFVLAGSAQTATD